MGVAGGPNIERDGLVFGYDTGLNPSSNFDYKTSTRRFFKGRPTTNLLSNPTDMTGDGWSLGNIPAEISITGNQPGPFGENNAILFTVDSDGGFYPHIRQVDKITGTTSTHTISIWAKSVSGSTRLDLVCFRSSPWSTAFSKTVTLTTEWQRYEVSGTPLDTTGHRIYFMCQNVPSGTATQVLMALPQAELSSTSTPFITGTRSVSGSLLDLTKSTTIDVSNVSFDSTGQPTFDGTDDYAEIEDATLFDFGTGDFSMEAVVKGTDTSNYRTVFYHYYNPGFVFITNITTGVMRMWIDLKVLNGSTNILDGDYHHCVAVKQGDSLTFYVDGQQDATSTGWSAKNATNVSKGASIGRYIDGTTSYPWNGNIPVLKAYSRALSATEVLQNFKAYKNRFNI